MTKAASQSPTDYYNQSALQHLKQIDNETVALKKVAKQFESLFLNMLMKSMREANKALAEDSIFNSEQVKSYQEMYDNQLSVSLASNKGIGLADALVRDFKRFVGNTIQTPEYNTKSSPSFNKRTTESVRANQNEIDKKTLFEKAEDFVNTLFPIIKEQVKMTHLDPKLILAQTALETGWGKSIIHDLKGASSHNLFGIKADKRWAGEKVSVKTLEYENGLAERKTEPFRKYQSFGESVKDYMDFVSSQPRYQKAMDWMHDAKSYITNLHESGYATDPNYSDKVMKIYHGDFLNSTLTSLGLTK